MTPLMVDLFAGLGGASAAMVERGWRVVRVDVDPSLPVDVVADVRHLPLECRPDLLWCSPPCDEFAREYMPWRATGEAPSLELVHASLAAVRILEPRWWVIENVQGARRWLAPVLGPYVQRLGSVYLWGRFPLVLLGAPPPRRKAHHTGEGARAPHARAVVPYDVSLGLALAVEACMPAVVG